MKTETNEVKMSITRALAKLKLVEKRIEKNIKSNQFVTIAVADKVTEDIAPVEAFQGIRDLIDYRNVIKRAIMLSNSTTTIQILDKEMLVIEAIDQKTAINFTLDLLNKMRLDLNEARQKEVWNNEEMKRRLDALLENSVGSKSKTSESEIKVISEAFEKRNITTLYDPLSVSEKIAKLEEEANNFISEIDLVLSESNATTIITI